MLNQGQDRREFFRLKFSAPLEYKAYDQAAEQASSSAFGRTDNISQSGILFQTEGRPPQLSSIVWMNLDMRTLKICQEIESKALIFNNGVIGKVVRVEEDPETGKTYDVGVCFLKKDQRDSRDVQELLKRM